jgi:hypothetical protein
MLISCQPTLYALFPYQKANGKETPVLPQNDEDIVFPITQHRNR